MTTVMDAPHGRKGSDPSSDTIEAFKVIARIEGAERARLAILDAVRFAIPATYYSAGIRAQLYGYIGIAEEMIGGWSSGMDPGSFIAQLERHRVLDDDDTGDSLRHRFYKLAGLDGDDLRACVELVLEWLGAADDIADAHAAFCARARELVAEAVRAA